VSFPPHEVDVAEIRGRHPIADVIAAAGVELRRSGHGYLGCCPFHDDTTPSMSVGGVPDRFHCFGCGASGDVIDFVGRLQGLGFRDAIGYLEASARTPARPRPPAGRPNYPAPAAWTSITQERGYEINRLAWEHLSNPVAHAFATSYLRNHRGIDVAALEEQTARRLVGHSGTGWTTLADRLRHQGVTDDELIAMDLAQPSRHGRLIDTLRDRLIVPVTTPSGLISGFIGRDTSGAPQAPKYRNPTRTATFDKSTALYRPVHHHTSPRATAVVVEGFLDALAVAAAAAQAGRLRDFWPCTANGVCVSAAQARRLIALDPAHIVLALDGDRAGADGTDRWLTAICRKGRHSAQVTRLPDGTDPADWIAEHGPGGLAAFDPTVSGTHAGVRPRQPGRELVRLALAEAHQPVRDTIREVLPLALAQPHQAAAELLAQAEAEAEAEMTRQGWNPNNTFTRALRKATTAGLQTRRQPHPPAADRPPSQPSPSPALRHH
jgi:DNA primase